MRASVRPFTLSNMNISATNWPIGMKFYLKHHWGGGKASVGFGQVYRVTDEALIAEIAVWPNFFLMNIFFALKGSKLFHYYLWSLQLDVVQCGGRKKSPRTHL